MSLSAWLTSSGAVERATSGVDSTGAPNSTGFATVTGKGALACAVWPVGSAAQQQFAQFSLIGNNVIAFATNPTARAGDRITVGTTYYLVNGVMTFANSLVCGETLYLVDATLRT